MTEPVSAGDGQPPSELDGLGPPPAEHACATTDDRPAGPTAPLPPLPVEATLRTAMDDVGTGFGRLFLIGAIAFVPIWAIVAATGDHPISTLVQFLALVPTAALLAAAGDLRLDRRPGVAASYRVAVRRLLDYFLANLVMGFALVLIALAPVLVLLVAAFVLAAQGWDDPTIVIGLVVGTMVITLIPVVWLMARLGLAGPMILVERLGVGEALMGSWRRTRRQAWRLIVVLILGSLPGWLIALGAALVGFGLLGVTPAAGAILGLGYAIACLVVSCLNVVAWQRLGGRAPDPGTTPDVVRRSDRGPVTAIALLSAGLLLLTIGSATSVGKVAGWIDGLSGQDRGVISYGLGGFGCLQLEERTAFGEGDLIHAVAMLTQAVPTGDRLQYEVYADDELVDQGYEEPFTAPTECVYFDLDTEGMAAGAYTFRYLWGSDLMAEGTFSLEP